MGVHWRRFLSGLKHRGLHGIELIVSDAQKGLRGACKAVFSRVQWAEEALPQGFTVISFPASHRRRLRTTNLAGRLKEEMPRRTPMAELFPNEASCLRLVTAVVMEIAEDWQTAEERYLVSGK